MHSLQTVLGRTWGYPGRGMLTDLRKDGQPVIFIHNPKTGGSSLGEFLHVGHLSHRFPSERLSRVSWERCFSIVVVRDPFERFLSCYYANVLRPQDNGLTKRYGRGIKSLDPKGFLAILAENPRYGGPQINWTDYPGSDKPRADLVLRFEDIDGWKGRLLAEGFDIADRSLPSRNRSERGASNHLQRLGLSKTGLAALRREVMDFFAEDCAAFGYSDSHFTDA